MTNVVHFFVYGTLKRGQCREQCWPVAPRRVQFGWTSGWLYDLGPYPAMVAVDAWAPSGRGDLSLAPRVAGELWSFDASHLALVTQVLDEIEVTNQPGQPNLYDRRLVDVVVPTTNQDASGESSAVSVIAAEAYFYANVAELAAMDPVQQVVMYQDQRLASWPFAQPS